MKYRCIVFNKSLIVYVEFYMLKHCFGWYNPFSIALDKIESVEKSNIHKQTSYNTGTPKQYTWKGGITLPTSFKKVLYRTHFIELCSKSSVFLGWSELGLEPYSKIMYLFSILFMLNFNPDSFIVGEKVIFENHPVCLANRFKPPILDPLSSRGISQH